MHHGAIYAFERFNGVLGSYFTNNKNIEPQITWRFSEHQAVCNEDIAFEEFKSIIPHNQQQEDKWRTISNSFFLFHYSNDSETIKAFAHECYSPTSSISWGSFLTEEADQLSNLYHQLYFNQGIKPSEIMAGDLISSNTMT